ncbi:MAG: mechanosensitive ion channel family protein [Saezia sp.]
MNETTNTATETVEHPPLDYIADNIFVHSTSGTSVYINLLIVAGIAAFVYILARFVTRPLINRFTSKENGFFAATLSEHRVIRNICMIIPSVILQIGLPLIPGFDTSIKTIALNLCSALTVLFTVRAVSAFFDAIIAYQESHSNPRLRSYKGLVQLLKIGLFIFGTILVVATLIDRSPAILISGLGAMSAVTMLIFKDTILSFVAGAQIISNDMLRVGDSIEMPQVGADGIVIDIALHTVKVQNSDKTIVTIPTWRLISESYKNWRGVHEANGRRLKRHINVDINSIKFMDTEDLRRLSHINVLHDYLKDKLVEIENYNKHIDGNAEMTLNRRRLTNIGTFRAYTHAYLRSHPKIRKDLALMVRQLQATGEGMPLEIYCFTATTVTAEHEDIQSDIFDHLYSIMPAFGLTPFQQIAGRDIVYALSPANTQTKPKKE